MSEPDYVQRLNYQFRRRRAKLIERKRQMHMWAWLSAGSTVLVALSLFFFVGWGGSREAAQAMALQADLFSPTFVRPAALLIIGGAAVALCTGQYARIKAKYDNLRHHVESLLPLKDVCNCHWGTCTCQDDFVEDMDKNYRINLNY